MSLAVLFRKVGEFGGVLGVPAVRHRAMVPGQQALGKIDVLVVRARHRAVQCLRSVSPVYSVRYIAQLVCVLLLLRFLGHGGLVSEAVVMTVLCVRRERLRGWGDDLCGWRGGPGPPRFRVDYDTAQPPRATIGDGPHTKLRTDSPFICP
jgi:hypothetical protein